jgi:hypothetical protein
LFQPFLFRRVIEGRWHGKGLVAVG